MIIRASTNNPLGQRPMSLHATLRGSGGLGEYDRKMRALRGIGWLGDAIDPLTGDLTTDAGVAVPAPWSPPGSKLNYTANWTWSSAITPNTVIAVLSAGLKAHGMQVTGTPFVANPISGALFGGGQISIDIFDQIGHDTQANAQSIPDSYLAQAVGASNILTSILSIVQKPTSPSAPAGSGGVGLPPADASTWNQWLQDNAGIIGVGAVAVILGVALVKKF